MAFMLKINGTTRMRSSVDGDIPLLWVAARRTLHDR